MHNNTLKTLLFSSLVLAAIGCGKEGVEAYADDVCGCKDTACLTGLQKKYQDLPELKLKL